MQTRRALLVAGVLALCAWCGWVSGFHRSTGAAVATWVVSLGAVVAVDVSFWRGRTRPGGPFRWHLAPARHPWPREGSGGGAAALRGLAPWLGLLVVVVVWEILGIDTGTHEAHLTVSALAQTYRSLNAALLLVWMLVGVGYGAARARAPLAHGASGGGGGGGGGGAVAMAWAAPRGAPTATGPGLLLPSNRPFGVAFWVLVVVAAVLIDLWARRSDGREATAEELVRFISASVVVNVVLVVAWAFAGYHLFAR